MRKSSQDLHLKAADRLSLLETLVDEMIKAEPEQKLVRQCMQQLGMTYTQDSNTQLSIVLDELRSLSHLKGQTHAENL